MLLCTSIHMHTWQENEYKSQSMIHLVVYVQTLRKLVKVMKCSAHGMDHFVAVLEADRVETEHGRKGKKGKKLK